MSKRSNMPEYQGERSIINQTKRSLSLSSRRSSSSEGETEYEIEKPTNERNYGLPGRNIMKNDLSPSPQRLIRVIANHSREIRNSRKDEFKTYYEKIKVFNRKYTQL